ncbi:ABC transporter ATP-binding protein [Acetobacterium sp.]|uniref:ABC transporter ATP-binding protein n=1 Tax=Acetobacterium sp. TaxID=1872094 RepID=UPI002F411200
MNIETKNLIKTYNDTTVLNLTDKNSRLFFESGKMHGILGPNGSGKSTLMKIMARLIPQTSGAVLYDSHPEDVDTQKAITYSSHRPILFSRTVFENIAYPLKIRKQPKDKIQSIVTELLDDFEISEIQNHNAKKISGGESQKTALARALSFSPEVLLLDEPTANIDPKSVKLIESVLLKRIESQGLTVIIITHNLSQAFRICDNLTFLDQGKCLYSGPSQGLIESANPFINEFISFNTIKA